MTTTTVLPGGPCHPDDPAAWTIPPTVADVDAWREQQQAKRGGFVASMRLRNAEKFALEAAHRAAQERAEPRPKPTPRPATKRTTTPRNRPAAAKHAEWRRLYESGLNSREIAERYGASRKTVLAGLRAVGTPMRAHTGGIAHPLDTEAIIAEYKAGGSLQDLANRHHCHQRRIRDVITSAGVSIRPHGAWRKGDV